MPQIQLSQITQVAIDIGGTFTDVVVVDEQGRAIHKKVPSTPTDPAVGFFDGLEAALQAGQNSALSPSVFLYGTTLATNAILERQLPRIGLIVTKGFRHILETGRFPQAEEHARVSSDAPPTSLIGLEDVQEIKERIDAHGKVETAIEASEIVSLAEWYQAHGIRTIVVSLLHSYLNPIHEQTIKETITAAGIDLRVILSSEVLPEAREYERTVAACLNAGLQTVMEPHVNSVVRQLRERAFAAPVLVMQSGGGLRSAQYAMQKPLATVFCGSSAAVVGGARLGAEMGINNLITFDMGGTSTDVSVVQNTQPKVTLRGHIDGYPIKARMIDAVTIGAGGGSIVSLGMDKRWHVGPRSAGAQPGPVCYAKGGTELSVTDAHLVLGHLPCALLGGALVLDQERAKQAVAAFGHPRGLRAVETAAGIIDITNQNMCGAIRSILVRNGYLPQNYSLLGMGGAGPLHACDLARLLGIAQIVIPPAPGLAAATGLLAADISEDFVCTLGYRASQLDIGTVHTRFSQLEQQAQDALIDERIPQDQQRFIRTLDVHYADLSMELSIGVPDGPITTTSLQAVIEDFHRHHEELCGHSYRERQDVEFATGRVTAIGLRSKPSLSTLSALTAPEFQAGSREPKEYRAVYFAEQQTFVKCPIYVREHLAAEAHIDGPAVIEQYDATTLIATDFRARVDRGGNLIVSKH